MRSRTGQELVSRVRMIKALGIEIKASSSLSTYHTTEEALHYFYTKELETVSTGCGLESLRTWYPVLPSNGKAYHLWY